MTDEAPEAAQILSQIGGEGDREPDREAAALHPAILLSAEERPMTDEAPEAAQYFSDLISAYTDAIRVSDFKANLTVLFVSIMMGPIVASRAKFPPFLSLPVILSPFLVAFFCLLICVYPRYPRRGRQNFLVVANPQRSDFVFTPEEGDEVDQLKLRCAILSGILYWKTFFLQIAFFICLFAVALIFFLLLYALL
jgi:hypothetical protein